MRTHTRTHSSWLSQMLGLPSGRIILLPIRITLHLISPPEKNMLAISFCQTRPPILTGHLALHNAMLRLGAKFRFENRFLPGWRKGDCECKIANTILHILENEVFWQFVLLFNSGANPYLNDWVLWKGTTSTQNVDTNTLKYNNSKSLLFRVDIKLSPYRVYTVRLLDISWR